MVTAITRNEGVRGSLKSYAEHGLGSVTWRYRARVRVHARAARVVPPAFIVEAMDEQTCFAEVGSDSAHDLALWLALLDADFDASHDPELAEELRLLACRLVRAAEPTRPG